MSKKATHLLSWLDLERQNIAKEEALAAVRVNLISDQCVKPWGLAISSRELNILRTNRNVLAVSLE